MVLLDLDGLGANFHAGVERFLPWHEFKALDDLQQSTKLREIFLKDPQFFNKLPVIESYHKLIDYLERSGERWMVCTSAGQDHPDYLVARDSKLTWLLREFNIESNKVIVTNTSAEKLNYANQFTVLVDDYGVNCERFKEAGGFSVKVDANTYNPDDVCVEIGLAIEAMHLLEVESKSSVLAEKQQRHSCEFEHNLATDLL